MQQIAALDGSFPALLVAGLIERFGLDGAHQEIDAALDDLSNVELAALEYDWENVWARPKQHAPLGEWQSWGYLAGRGNGKTVGISHWVNEEVEQGRAPLICLIAQDEDSSVKLHVTGPSGLLATAKPWFRPAWHPSDLELVWPNGSKAYVRTPEVPRKIRGLEYDLAWMSEIQSWPAVTREDAYMNVLISTRLGLSRIVWDATAARRHPLLKRLMKQAAAEPMKHVLVTGSTYENVLNLGKGYIEKIEAAYGGTQQGEEELFGRMFDDTDGATAKQAWIDRNRRAVAGTVVRRVVSVDPAVTARGGSDCTGIVDAGLSADGKALILGDHSGRHAPEEWAAKTLDLYVDGRCDLVIVETNKGGNLLVRNLRAAADERHLSVVVIGKDERAPGHQKGTVHVREIYSRGEKADRARPLSTAIQKNRVGFVGTFTELEDTLTTWQPTPGARSPDRLDATVAAVVELLGLDVDAPDPKAAFAGILEANRALTGPPQARPRRTISSLFGGSGNGGGRI